MAAGAQPRPVPRGDLATSDCGREHPVSIGQEAAHAGSLPFTPRVRHRRHSGRDDVAAAARRSRYINLFDIRRAPTGRLMAVLHAFRYLGALPARKPDQSGQPGHQCPNLPLVAIFPGQIRSTPAENLASKYGHLPPCPCLCSPTDRRAGQIGQIGRVLPGTGCLPPDAARGVGYLPASAAR